ncbi:MAG: transporter suffix domain-containing protein [Bacteroidales bacterium]|nr:transporter suffix domain-containing protein [Bacteroidales bacterium]MCF8391796.1 transporter suffix domain-containing protein [Bacteroidales bacterium]
MRDKSWKFRLGLILVIISIVFFGLLVVIPFLSIEKSNKILFTTITLITAEVLFYSGGFLLGKELFTKYKSYLNPKRWFNKSKRDQE